ncbi:MAG TPA: TolC family protein [Vicinamibacterales bacterium]|jgi:outer membrane protein TolC
MRKLFIGVLLLVTPPVTAQQALHDLNEPRTYGGPPLSLSAALREAQDKNPELIALRRQFESTRFRSAEQRYLSPPMLEGQIWQWPINTLNPANTNMYMFMASQEIPGRGKRALRAAAAEKDSQLAAADIAVRAQEILNGVKQRYTELFLARRSIDVHLASVGVLRQLADISQAKYAAGRISQQDVLKAIVELSKVHGDVIMFEQQTDLAAARLNTLLDREPDAPIGPLTEPREQILTASVEDLQRLAIKNHPELQRMRVEIERAQAGLAVTRQDYKPDYSVQAGYLLMPHMTDAWLAKFAITWPRAPWSRGAIDARVAGANAEVEAANAELRTMERAVRLSVQDAYIRVKAAERRAGLLRTTILPQSRQTLDVSRIGYQTDRVDFLSLVDNERTLLGTELDYFRALSELEQGTADLEQAIGSEVTPGMRTPVDVSEVGR